MSNPQQEYKESLCIVCRRSASGSDGKYITIQGEHVFICSSDLHAFGFGRAVGQTELHSVVVQCLASIDNEATGWTLKEKLYGIVPQARRQVLESQRISLVRERSPREIFIELDRTVVGQREAKQRISLAIFEHVRSIKAESSKSIVPDKHNVLLLGPSGSGKTLLAHTAAKSLEMPFVSSDATGFSPTGFQGADADSVIHDLFMKSGCVINTAERGIVFLDELDKLSSYHHTGNREFLNNATQSALLRMIEGKDVKVPSALFGDSMRDAPVVVNTSKILFFCGGAFHGLSDVAGKLMGYTGRRMSLRSSGNAEIEKSIANYEILASASPDTLTEALIEYGLIAELVGRIPVIVPLAPLTKEELMRCLCDLDHSPLVRAERLFLGCGYKIDMEDEAKERVVDIAHKMATGTRALGSILKKAISQAEFDLLEPMESICRTGEKGRVILTIETLDSPACYRLESTRRKPSQTAVS